MAGCEPRLPVDARFLVGVDEAPVTQRFPALLPACAGGSRRQEEVATHRTAAEPPG
jgi:hypothetical protein